MEEPTVRALAAFTQLTIAGGRDSALYADSADESLDFPHLCRRHTSRHTTELPVEREVVEMRERWAARLGAGIACGADAEGHRLTTQVHAQGAARRWGSDPSDTTWIEPPPALSAHARWLARLSCERLTPHRITAKRSEAE